MDYRISFAIAWGCFFCACESYVPVASSSPGNTSVTVSWNAQTESDLSGYKIYYGTESGSYDDVLDVGDTTSFPINNLVVGTTYFFVVTAYDFSGNESGFSDEVSTTITDTVPTKELKK